MGELLDCIIIGGGPGGLAAGIYLQRYRRKIAIIDNHQSRAAIIPRTHNYPGFPGGISGLELLKRLKQQLQDFGGQVTRDTVQTVTKEQDIFTVKTLENTLLAKKIILATGASDIEPSLPNLRDSIRRGLIRHCPVCDGYEVIDQKIAVIGNDDKAIAEAIFLRTYSASITLLSLGQSNYSQAKVRQLKKLNIRIINDTLKSVVLEDHNQSTLITQDDQEYRFDTLYSALGSIVHSKLAINLGAKSSEQCLLVNRNQETSVKGLYAVGDVVKGLNQICVATAGAAIAATEVHNKLK